MKRGRSLLLIILLVAALAALILYMNRSAIHGELSNLKLIPQPEHFTELYFDNHLSLPKNIVAKQPVSFSFVIHNLEGATTTYPFSVYFEYPGGTRITLTSSSVTLADNASTSIAVVHTFRTSNLTGMVVVNLMTLDQQIDFIVPNTNP